MVDVINFYLDDSGTRHPTRNPGRRADHGYDWFALGGILVNDKDEDEARALYKKFCKDWDITSPLHSSEIRSQNENFLWLRGLEKEDRERFYEELYQLLRNAPVIGLACVVDRPGYKARYLEMYEKAPWLLCKTAFSVAVERAAKNARSRDCRLRVSPERCNKPEDNLIKGYYRDLKAEGLPFATDNSEKYGPLSAKEFGETLYELKPKYKTSPMAQLADLFLWPICMGGYNATNRPYARLMADGKLIECTLPEDQWPFLATKYSCFDLVERKV